MKNWLGIEKEPPYRQGQLRLWQQVLELRVFLMAEVQKIDGTVWRKRWNKSIMSSSSLSTSWEHSRKEMAHSCPFVKSMSIWSGEHANQVILRNSCLQKYNPFMWWQSFERCGLSSLECGEGHSPAQGATPFIFRWCSQWKDFREFQLGHEAIF